MNEWIEITLRLGLATLAGVLLGANRWLHHKSAGVKTHALVSIGAALAMLIVMPVELSESDLINISADAASRVLQGLLTGVGFLGAGVIIHNARGKRIQGLTTAASIWITTMLGAAIGSGQLALGLIAVVATGVVLLLGNSIERLVDRKFGNHEEASKDENQP
jgi:putative Mg2+ transporter-C (MgtC) family protein